MQDNRDAIRPYVADMAAVEKHILEALERQHGDDTLKNHPQALSLVGRLKSELERHVEILENQLRTLPAGGVAATVKESVAGVLGGLAGLYDKVRKDEVSRALRDDYTALSLATVSYTMLHSTALGLGQVAVAEISLRHLKDLTPFVMELAEVIPPVVLHELALEGYDIDVALSAQATKNTQEAWDPESVRAGAAGATR
jgi:hypothetical protein